MSQKHSTAWGNTVRGICMLFSVAADRAFTGHSSVFMGSSHSNQLGWTELYLSAVITLSTPAPLLYLNTTTGISNTGTHATNTCILYIISTSIWAKVIYNINIVCSFNCLSKMKQSNTYSHEMFQKTHFIHMAVFKKSYQKRVEKVWCIKSVCTLC